MLDLHPMPVSVVACHASAHELDSLTIERAFPFRVAVDELLLLDDPTRGHSLTEDTTAHLGRNGVVIDQTDGFAGWTLRGEDASEAFLRLSALPLPAAAGSTTQGLVAHTPAKVIVADRSVHILVPSTLGHHFYGRVMTSCVDLAVRECDPDPFKPPVAMSVTA